MFKMAVPVAKDNGIKLAVENHSAILVVTHDHRMVEGFDRIFEVRDGRITGEKIRSPL